MALESSLCVLGISRCFEDSLRIALQERDSGCDQCFLRGCVFSKQNVVQPQLAFVGSLFRVHIGISTSVSDKRFPRVFVFSKQDVFRIQKTVPLAFYS